MIFSVDNGAGARWAAACQNRYTSFLVLIKLFLFISSYGENRKPSNFFFSFYYKALAVSVSANRFKSLYKLYTVTRGFMEIEIRGRTFWFKPIPRKQNKMWLVCCSLVGAAQLAVHQQVCLFNDEVSDLAEWTGEMGTRGSGDFCILRLIQDFKLKWN